MTHLSVPISMTDLSGWVNLSARCWADTNWVFATGGLLYTLSPLFLIKWKSFLLRSTHFVSVEAVTLEHSNQLPTVYHSLDTLGNPPVANTQLVSAQHLADKLTRGELSPGDWAAYLSLEREIPKNVRRAIAMEWSQLRGE